MFEQYTLPGNYSWLIAPAGQVPSQAPQEIQASEITYAIVISSLYK